MDPNETLEQIRALLRGSTLDPTAASSLTDLVSGLDDWLSNGGFTPAAWTTAPRSGLEGTIGVIDADRLRVGDVLLFPARELWSVEKDGFSVIIDDGHLTDSLSANQELLVFRPNHPLSREHEGCPDCPAEPDESCHLDCQALASVDENAHAYLARLGLTRLD